MENTTQSFIRKFSFGWCSKKVPCSALPVLELQKSCFHFLLPVAVSVLAKTLWGQAPKLRVAGGTIISSRWKNWGLDKKVRGRGPPPGPGLEPPLLTA